MNTPLRRIVLAVTMLIGLFVGGWAEILPRAFYDGFPGFGLHWIDIEGAYDEHLIRDLGAMYLALAALSIAGIAARTALPGRLAGLGWTVFNLLHVGYHLLHPEGSAFDVAAVIATLVLALVLGALLLPRSRRDDRSVSSTREAAR
jgi:hypothetical protein